MSEHVSSVIILEVSRNISSLDRSGFRSKTALAGCLTYFETFPKRNMTRARRQNAVDTPQDEESQFLTRPYRTADAYSFLWSRVFITPLWGYDLPLIDGVKYTLYGRHGIVYMRLVLVLIA